MLSDDLSKVSSVYNNRMIGKTYAVLVRDTDRKAGFFSAQTEGKITVRFASEDKSLIGQIINVKITSASNFSVEGELIQV